MLQTAVYYRQPGALLFDPAQGWNLGRGMIKLLDQALLLLQRDFQKLRHFLASHRFQGLRNMPQKLVHMPSL